MLKPSALLPGRRTRLAITTAAAVAALAVTGALVAATPASSHTTTRPSTPKPTIVLVHGAWADASSWAKVTRRLQDDGYPVLAPPNPLRGLSGDAAYLAAFLQQRTTGPVILVGHSYGGAVISSAALTDPDVKALVYINAFVPDQGETILGLQGGGGDPSALFDFVGYPGAPAGDADLYIKTAVFPGAFAGDLPAATAATLAAAQRPITFGALQEPAATAAWKTLPSWYLLGTDDHILPPSLQETMAERAHSRITRVAASHLSMLSKPEAVEKIIIAAARSAR
ncbi:pimeloyl-ACP methyl ester carboxylesterase [Allocatelliglobosispora scoriae]|uniref:Pimeloyl-ACP methyl ester carboxylesterase n=1 Tax=Allocatelliglobosispora scoriae TaxID=643052 RepID=A0A841BL80_9ACTN|nr:alpha/beta hydrolase [Allocatelliglobosispora scoriae]MBB5867570.1 pimeloyl-ACP methyl ester carboxylesterase [Allocatelliglobosispora scoriae]